MMKASRKVSIGLSILLSLTIAACGGSSGGGGNPPPSKTTPTVSAWPTASAITYGQTLASSTLSGGTASVTGSFSWTTSTTAPGAGSPSEGVTFTPTDTTDYNTVAGSVGVTVNKATPTVSAWPTASAITFLQTLASSTLSGGTASVPGAFAWTTSTTSPSAGAPSESVTFTPTDATDYNTVAGTVNVTVNQATPTVTAWPTASAITSGQTLSSSTLTGGAASPLGTFAWTTPTLVPSAGTPSESVTFTPSDATDYSTVTGSVTVTVNAAPSITSFTPKPATITAGSNSSLTAVFAGGAGVVTPGNITVTSGVAITVTPAATTTYTLTVTPTVGQAINSMTTVTVVAAPAITSFIANPTSVASGSPSGLTGVFTGGTGVITPGNLAATSGTAVSVSPTTTTTYTLTVTNAAGTPVTAMATVTVATSVTVNPANAGIAVTNQLLGMNMAVWFDFTSNTPAIVDAFQSAGIVALRWPGGSTSDDYHWNGTSASNPANGVAPTPSTCQGAYQSSNTNYLNFITNFEHANGAPTNGYDIALTADYGTNPTCNGGGSATEAANWVQYANANGGTVSHVTVGNENYGSWEEDMHVKEHDPGTYAASVIGSTGYYSLIKAQSPSTLVGVIVDANSNCCASGWDSTVLSSAKGSYDFVEFHYYPQNPGGESDTFLVQQAAPEFTTNINTIKQELTTAGEANTPIYVGEMGSVSSNPGKQSVSITQGLFAGQMLGEMMNDGISRATWWIGFGNCNGTAGNDSSSLYGWQSFGAYNVFSDGSEDPTCPGYGPFGTMSPTAQAFSLFQNVAVNGEHVLTPAVSGDTTDVRAYAATHSGGTALVLFNVNETTSQTVTVTVNGETTSPGVTVITYDKSIYDQTDSVTPVWANPTTTTMGSQTIPLTLTLSPWSMNVVLIQ
jgi:alpha-L-arabinofuranosidase